LRHARIAGAHRSAPEQTNDVLVDSEPLEGVDAAARERLVATWEAEASAALGRLAGEVEKSAWARAAETAHGLAGAALQMGAERMGRVARQLEESAMVGDASLVRMRAVVRELRALLVQSLELLRKG
jgi:HPt (histidine-containing phosphotransfer) domain-containing protein